MWTDMIAALDATGLSFAHFAWAKNAPELSADHGVYSEDDENTLFANGKHAESVLQGTIDYFTRDDSKAPKATIEAALDSVDVAWYVNSIQFEDDTGFIHYEWVFEAVDDRGNNQV